MAVSDFPTIFSQGQRSAERIVEALEEKEKELYRQSQPQKDGFWKRFGEGKVATSPLDWFSGSEDKQKEFMPQYAGTEYADDYDVTEKGLAPLPEAEITGTSDAGIGSLIPRLNILGDKPEYNTDNPLMDELLALTKPKKGSNEELAALFFGMTNPKDRTFGAAVGAGGRSALEYREKQNARYYKAIGLGAVRQDQINKTRYQTDIDWQLANREADVDIWSAQTKAGAKGFDVREWLGDVNEKRLEQLGDELTNPDRLWAPGDKELAEEVWKTMKTQLFLELIFKRPLKGGGNISDN